MNSYTYDPFGSILARDEQVDCAMKYHGQQGMVHMEREFVSLTTYSSGQRTYAVELGQFISKPPFWVPGSCEILGCFSLASLKRLSGYSTVLPFCPRGFFPVFLCIHSVSTRETTLGWCVTFLPYCSFFQSGLCIFQNRPSASVFSLSLISFTSSLTELELTATPHRPRKRVNLYVLFSRWSNSWELLFRCLPQQQSTSACETQQLGQCSTTNWRLSTHEQNCRRWVSVLVAVVEAVV